MKKIFAFIGLAVAMLTVSCSQDVDLTPAVDGKVVLGVTIEDNTRTALGALNGEKYSVVWSEGDKIAVNSVTSDAVAAASVGTSSAQFAVAGVTAPYSALYPAEVLNADGTITVPTVQNYTEGSFAVGSAVAVGYSENTTLALKNLYSFVKVTIAKAGNETIKSVILKTVGGETLSGVFAVDYQKAAISTVAGQSVIRVMNVPYGADGKAVVYIAVPAGYYTEGFELTVTDTENKAMTKKASAVKDIPAGYLVNMPEFTFAGVAQECIVISTAEELVTLATDYAFGFDGKAVFANDIDMTGVTALPQFSILEGAEFDGQGFALKNWTSNKALIAQNFGTVKNITLDASCALTMDLDTDPGASAPNGILVDANLGVISGCINNADVVVAAGNVIRDRSIGVIAGVTGCTVPNNNGTMAPDARIENCINNGNVTISMDSYNSGWLFAGGIAGSYYPHAVASETGGLFNCVNNGDFTLDITTNPKVTCVGGICGSVGKFYPSSANNGLVYCKVENCVNNGNVTYTGSAMTANFGLAGVAGYCSGEMTNVINNGNVKLSLIDPTTAFVMVGGVAGVYTANLTDVHNTGKVELDNVQKNGKQWFIGGVAGINSNKNNSDMALTLTNVTNSGEVDVRYTAAENGWVFVGGIFGDTPHTNPLGDKSDVVSMTDCVNSGAINVVPVGASRLLVGAISGQIEKGGPCTNCVNKGDITVTGDGESAYEAYVGGISATCNTSLVGCQSLGNLSVNGAAGFFVGGIGARLNNTAVAWDGCVLDSAITYGEGATFGLLLADTWLSTNSAAIGATSPIVVKKTTTVNGVAVDEAFIAEHSNLLGRDQKVLSGELAESQFKVAEGGVVLE